MRALFYGAALALALAVPAGAQQVTLKLGHVDNEASHSGVGVNAFAAEVEKLSNGSLKLEVFHAGKLGPIPTQIQNTFQGSQDLHLIYPEFLSNFLAEAKLISMPYLFQSLDHLQKFYKSPLFKPAIDKLDAQGAIILDTEWTWKIHDPRGFIVVRPIFTPDEMKGLKLRIWEDKTAIESWKGFGANTTVVPRPEMYLAFKQGIIEGGPETIGIAYDQKNAEVAKYWVRTEEYYQIINMMVNKRKFNGLSPQHQAVLRQAMSNAGKTFVQATMAAYEDKKLKSKEEMGVTVIEPPLGPWRARGAQTVAKLVSENYVPGDLIEKVRALK